MSRDLLVLHGVGLSFQADPGLADAAGSGYSVTGPRKAAQRYLHTLLCSNVSDSPLPALGTSFLSDVRAGAGRSLGAAVQAFALANVDALAILAADSAGLPDSERVASAELRSVSVDPARGAVYFSVRLETAAGEGALLEIPSAFPET